MTAYYVNQSGGIRASQNGGSIQPHWRPVLVVDPEDDDLLQKIAREAGTSVYLVRGMIERLIEDAIPMEEPTTTGSVVTAHSHAMGARVRWTRVDGSRHDPWVFGRTFKSWSDLIDPRPE